MLISFDLYLWPLHPMAFLCVFGLIKFSKDPPPRFPNPPIGVINNYALVYITHMTGWFEMCESLICKKQKIKQRIQTNVKPQQFPAGGASVKMKEAVFPCLLWHTSGLNSFCNFSQVDWNWQVRICSSDPAGAATALQLDDICWAHCNSVLVMLYKTPQCA